MHQALQILEWWALAFLSLGAALFFLNIFFSLIENDLTLLSLGKEAAIPAIASLIEGASVWAVATYLPMAGRALFIPGLMVALLYKIAHYQDWTHYDVFALLMFQLIIVAVGCCLFTGQFSMALTILFFFFVCLAAIYVFAKGL